MKLENINNDKFKKLEKYQEDNLDAIKGGEESFTWWWSDTNVTKETSSSIDYETKWNIDATTKTADTIMVGDSTE